MENNSYIPSTYERIILIKKIKYWLYWPLFGFFTFLLGELSITLTKDQHYWAIQVLFALGVGFLPVAYILFSHQFQKVMKAISRTFWDDNDVFNAWLKKRCNRIFTLSTWQSIVFTFMIVILGIITVLFLGLPFSSSVLKALSLIGFSWVLFICGHGAYICVDLLFTLYEVAHKKPSIPFFRMEHPAIAKLQNLYYFVALTITLGYISLTITIWQSPYGLVFLLQIWLTILSLYPLSIFFWTFFQTHHLLKNIKLSHLEIINDEVIKALSQVQKKKGLQDAEYLEKMMSIQGKVQSTKEWPLAGQDTITFLITFITVIVQLTVSILSFLKP